MTQQAAENRPAKLKRVRENRMASIKRKIHRSKKRLSFTDLVSTEPGSLAGRYMRRFWHPVHRADDLMPGQAKPIQIMSERFTLYRGEGGAPHVVGFRCAHRGTQLSAGWVEGDCIRCMYHGWLYDSTGQCVEQLRIGCDALERSGIKRQVTPARLAPWRKWASPSHRGGVGRSRH